MSPTDDDSPVYEPEKGRAATASFQGYSQLDPELADFAKTHRETCGAYPSDDELRKHASCVVHQGQTDWKTTAANNAAWLTAFKQRHFEREAGGPIDGTTPPPPPTAISSANNNALNLAEQPSFKQSQFFLNGSCYRRLAWDLDRFVAAAMSPNNPNRHVPTDEELKHQARCILYDE